MDSQNINATLYQSSNFVVLSNGGDYASSITAATFAARFNIPLFFTPLSNSDQNLIKKWHSKTIGIGVTGKTNYNLSVDEANNFLKDGSDYLILTTSDDLTKTSNPRFSLAAPILAGGRDGLVLNVKNPTRESVKRAVANITRNGFSPAYMVAVGNENNFPFLQSDIVQPGTFYNQDDDHQYFVNLYYWADYNSSNEYIPDASVGAITGYFVSDASSLIARSLFYDKIAKSDKVIAWSPYSSGDLALRQGGAKIDPVLSSDFIKKYVSNFKDFNLLSDKTTVVSEIKDSSVFVYSGHAWRNTLGNMGVAELPVFNSPTFVFAFGCAALEPWNPGTLEANQGNPVVGYEAIKNGAVGFLGSAEIKFVSSELYFGSDDRMMVQNAFTQPIGLSQFLTSRMTDAYYLYTTGNNQPESNYYYKSYTYLLGDPKLKLKTSTTLSQNIATNSVRLDFQNKSILERFVAVTPGGGYVMCSFDEKQCHDLLNDPTRNATEFNFPILLDKSVFSTDLSYAGTDAYSGRTNLRFFTESPVKNLTTNTDSNLSPNPGYKYTGAHCLKLGGKQYCPNLLLYLPYGYVNAQTKEIQSPKYIDINLSY